MYIRYDYDVKSYALVYAYVQQLARQISPVFVEVPVRFESRLIDGDLA